MPNINSRIPKYTRDELGEKITNVLYTRSQVAQICNVSESTIWLWEKKGLIKSDSKRKSSRRYSLHDLYALLVDGN